MTPEEIDRARALGIDFNFLAASRRIPRDTFTRRLLKLGALWNSGADHGVLGVAVYGSYARGAPTCGDLDLVVLIRPGYETRVRQAIRRGPVPVQIHDVQFKGPGSPDEELADALATYGALLESFTPVVVWTPTRTDVAANVAGIEVTPTADRHLRPQIINIHRVKDGGWGESTVVQLTKRVLAGELRFQFIPFDAIVGGPPEVGDASHWNGAINTTNPVMHKRRLLTLQKGLAWLWSQEPIAEDYCLDTHLTGMRGPPAAYAIRPGYQAAVSAWHRRRPRDAPGAVDWTRSLRSLLREGVRDTARPPSPPDLRATMPTLVVFGSGADLVETHLLGEAPRPCGWVPWYDPAVPANGVWSFTPVMLETP